MRLPLRKALQALEKSQQPPCAIEWRHLAAKELDSLASLNLEPAVIHEGMHCRAIRRTKDVAAWESLIKRLGRIVLFGYRPSVGNTTDYPLNAPPSEFLLAEVTASGAVAMNGSPLAVFTLSNYLTSGRLTMPGFWGCCDPAPFANCYLVGS
jgi:hypothetical protein